MAKIIIIGAGLTGLSTAYHLEKRGFFDYELFEKEATIGGLCRSMTHDGFTFDFTGHLLHCNDSYFKSLLTTIIGLDNFNTLQRKSYIYSHNTYTHYPFQINLNGLPEDIIADCIEGYVNRPQTTKKPRTFAEWAVNNFGKGCAKHFFLPYQRKIFAYNVHKLSADWTGRFVPKTSLREMIIGALRAPEDNGNIGYNAHFVYPKQGGIFSWVNALAQTITKPIHTNHEVKAIDLAKRIIYFANGRTEPFDILITTMPLDTFLTQIKEKPTTNFHKALPHLDCASVIDINLGIARPNLSEKHWIYFPETLYPFYRIGFPHNFSEHMTPPGCSSLYSEIAHNKASGQKINLLAMHGLNETKKLLAIAQSDIITENIAHLDHAYVIYNFWRKKNLPRLLQQLEQESIYSIGRYGAWKYSSMQEAILDGKKMAETITILPAKTDYHQPSTQKNSIKEHEVS